MLYALLKSVHLLAIIVWIGGMFFALACLRPALVMLEPAARVGVMTATLRRFFTVVGIAAALVLASGAGLIALARSGSLRSGLAFNMPLDWYVMAGLFFVMLAVFAHIRLRLFRRLEAAVAAGRWPDGAALLGNIRLEVMLNLVLGGFIVVVVAFGQAG